MNSIPQDMTTIYRTVCQYATRLYSHMPNVSTEHLWKGGKAFFAAHKNWVIGTALVVSALIMNRLYRISMASSATSNGNNNQPSGCLQISSQSSLNCLELKIIAPNQIKHPTLVFCIDRSGSMALPGRIEDVKESMGKVAEDAIKQSQQAGMKIKAAVVVFDAKASVMCRMGELTEKTKKTFIDQVNSIKCAVHTNIPGGLKAALEQFKDSQNDESKILILLTDGQQGDLMNRVPVDLQNSNKQGVTLYAVGIGKEHAKDSLQRLVSWWNKSELSAKYIDTTQEGYSIKETVNNIWQEAKACYSNLALTTLNLAFNQWSVPSKKVDKDNICDLGVMGSKEAASYKIFIPLSRLEQNLDLSKVSFTLTGFDWQGKKVSWHIPWSPNSWIIPKFFK